MTKRVDYQNPDDKWLETQEARNAELRAFHKAAIEASDAHLTPTATVYQNPNPGVKPVEGTDEQPNASAELEEATPAEQEAEVEKQAEREAEVHPPIEEPVKEEEAVEEPKADEKPKETAAQKKAREAKEAKAEK